MASFALLHIHDTSAPFFADDAKGGGIVGPAVIVPVIVDFRRYEIEDTATRSTPGRALSSRDRVPR